MKIERFEDLIVWQKSQDLAVVVYEICSNMKDFGFKDQICRASISMSNNIAEGFDRYSKKEFIRFLYIAKGSCAEVKSMAYLGQRLGYLVESKSKEMQNQCEEIAKIIRGLINSLEKQ
jgi:four helix bundle protein